MLLVRVWQPAKTIEFSSICNTHTPIFGVKQSDVIHTTHAFYSTSSQLIDHHLTTQTKSNLPSRAIKSSQLFGITCQLKDKITYRTKSIAPPLKYCFLVGAMTGR
jgi:hypothetical protein